jgi:hypothetical protein
MKKTLIDRTLKALKPAEKPFEAMVTAVRGFGLRVLGKLKAVVEPAPAQQLVRLAASA